MDYEGKDGPHSNSGGVKPFPIATRFERERERLAGGFTPADRAWRKQYLQDQILHPNDPSPEGELAYYRARYNPIRRMYKAPLNMLFAPLLSKYNHELVYTLRYGIGRGLLLVGAIYIGAYWLKYNPNNWTKKGGWAIIQSHEINYDESRPYTKLGPQHGSLYYDQGFKDAPI